jgi:hypothetical protein
VGMESPCTGVTVDGAGPLAAGDGPAPALASAPTTTAVAAVSESRCGRVIASVGAAFGRIGWPGWIPVPLDRTVATKHQARR